MDSRNTVMVSVEIPEGYELADTKMRAPKKGEWALSVYGEPYQTVTEGLQCRVIVRPIAPQYVYPKVRREDAEARAKHCVIHGHPSVCATSDSFLACRESAAMREALEAKGEPVEKPEPVFGSRIREAIRILKGESDLTETVGTGVSAKPEPVCGKHHHRTLAVEQHGGECSSLCIHDCQWPVGHA